jgi:hypothetical protein
MPYRQRKSGQAKEETAFIQSVQNEAGYAGQLKATNSQQSDGAARLLTKLFREGVTDRGAELFRVL